MTLTPFRGLCHTCWHDHDAEAQLVRDGLDIRQQATRARPHEKPLLQWSSQAVLDVAAERRRQIEVEGWTPEHDDCHRDGSLAKAAYCYAWAACGLGMESPPPAPPGWPWAGTWWKPRDTRSNLVRAAALLLAEIDRLDRQAGEKT